MLDRMVSLARTLDDAGIPFTFDAGSALYLQGVQGQPDDIDISVPWALLSAAHQLFGPAEPIKDRGGWAKFRFIRDGVPVDILSYKGTDLATDPERVALQLGARVVHVKALSFFARNLAPDDPRLPAIRARLA